MKCRGASFGIAVFTFFAWQLTEPAMAEDVSFAGKTITVIIGSTPGGTTDSSTRIMIAGLSKYLPGSPTVIIQARPGAHSISAMNYFAQQVKPDGLTAGGGSASQIDPETTRMQQAQYDPTKFFMVGGVDLGGGVIVMRADAKARLLDKKTPPVVMGSSSGLPSSTVMTAAWGIEYLGWNVHWVSGYPSASSGMALALERGELDMTGFSTAGISEAMFDRNKFSIIYQTGAKRCSTPSSLPELKGVEIFATAMKGKISDPVAKKAFEYWCNSSSTFVWMALPPGTPAPIVDAYRAAFAKMEADSTLIEQGQKFSKEFAFVPHEAITTLVNNLAALSPDVTNFMPELLRKQGRPIN